MDDLELLRRMTGEAPIADDATRARMRASLDERIEQAPASKRRRSRSGVVAILVAAGVGIGTVAAAAGVIRHWSEAEPVAISVLPGNHDPGSFEGNTLDISEPERRIASAAEFEATVAEFAPAIRLPEGHDFTAWEQHVEEVTDFTSADGIWNRSFQAGTMVFVAECQWGQHWVDANEGGDFSCDEPVDRRARRDRHLVARCRYRHGQISADPRPADEGQQASRSRSNSSLE